jgi:hypothetical protein
VSKGGRPKEAVVTFTSGLAWLKVQERRTSQRPQPYGPVSPLAEEVTLPGGGVALFEPAQGDRPRRVSIRGADLSAYLESNLSRGDLIEVAASIPLHPVDPPTEGTPGTASGGDRLSLEEAAALVPFDIAPPGVLPPGYGLVSVELVEAGATPAVTLHFHDDSRDVAGGIRLHLAAGDGLPPASSATQFTLELAGVEGRHTPSRHQLEWVSGGVYHALDGPGLELADLLGIAESIPGPPAGEEESPGAETDTPVPDEPGTDGPALGNGATFGEWLEVGAR